MLLCTTKPFGEVAQRTTSISLFIVGESDGREILECYSCFCYACLTICSRTSVGYEEFSVLKISIFILQFHSMLKFLDAKLFAP